MDGCPGSDSDGLFARYQDDPAFVGRHNLLNQDQGLRAFLQVSNDVCYVSAQSLAQSRSSSLCRLILMNQMA